MAKCSDLETCRPPENTESGLVQIGTLSAPQEIDLPLGIGFDDEARASKHCLDAGPVRNEPVGGSSAKRCSTKNSFG